MKSLNDLYNKSCKPKCGSYKQISSHITLIDNFFEDFETARDFFINREKWKCIPYQDHSKPGHESLFPNWIGKSLMEKYVLDNRISDDMNSYTIVCNFMCNQPNYSWSIANLISNSTHFPHYDGVESDNILGQICLINLNKVSVSTKFYTYKNKEYLTNETIDEWNNYIKNLTTKLKEYYNKDNISRDEIKLFLDTQKLDTKLIKTVEYKPNQAIIYSENLFHLANITQEFTKDNPRCLLRIRFDKKFNKNMINYV
jgi:hypothetical protein